ncbi:histidine kinase [Novimethylophilus kurashikiensis]|uniref:Histidine kinase n=2 Tax=Novimethylophilus kurashikiensis TaxID=1825523 RepID=A0A2R5F1W3_9PROT|nr:histidine kinase [Novimethylophilus kurashikiensis]
MKPTQRLPSVADVAQINESIKYAVSLSSQINLNALNSTLVANKAGAAGIGFAVVARELRGFSQRFAVEMGAMTQEVFQLVNGISRLSNTQRLFRLLQKAQQQCRENQDRLENPVMRRGEYLERERLRMERGARKIFSALEIASKRCDMGLMIARSARVEAAHGGSYQSALTQVAGDMEYTIGEISTTVRAIAKRLSK